MGTENYSAGTKRLLELAAFLEALDPRRFNYSVWAGGGPGSRLWEQHPLLRDAPGLPDCKTTACALGWATTLPFAKDFALRLEGGTVRDRNGHTDSYAGCDVFGLTGEEAYFLFRPDVDPDGLTRIHGDIDWPSPDPEAGPEEVAAHIRRFVEVAR